MRSFVHWLKNLPLLLKLLLVLVLFLITLVFLLQVVTKISGENALTPAQIIPGSEDTEKQTVKVEKVIDGDTIRITGGQLVRYIGIDSPEMEPPGCFSQEAYSRNKELVEGQTVELVKDVSETDKYGRLLRYIYLNGQSVNELLVREGFAVFSPFPPDVKYRETFINAEREAKAGKLGIWKDCTCSAKISCFQMLDCAEVKFYLQTCQRAEFDADGDGLPCEEICP